METGTMSTKLNQARRRTVVSPPRVMTMHSSSSPANKSKGSRNSISHRFSKLFPEGLLRPYWWIYFVLIVGGICVMRIAEYSANKAAGYTPDFPNRTDDAVMTTTDTGGHFHLGDTLALVYPPGLFGGYRNQVLRFVAFVVYAMQNGYTNILVESLVWSTEESDGKTTKNWIPVPHDMLFDVGLWNSILGEDLPRLVRYQKDRHRDWEIPKFTNHESPLVSAVLQRGFMKPIRNYAEAYTTSAGTGATTKFRKIDLMPNVSHCEYPAAYGGGKGAGRLWWDNQELHNKAQRSGQGFPFQADAKILKALKPKEEFRNLATQCVVDGTNQQQVDTKKQKVPYVALHARVELEMLVHKCGKNMEKNLTKIFDMVDGLVNKIHDPIKGIFVAVSRSGIESKEEKPYMKFQELADENLETLNRVAGQPQHDIQGIGLRHGALSVFECGKGAVQKYYDQHPESPNFGAILESMVNFHVATEATAFVGVQGSSYSTDIWTTRYYNGKGDSNYEYTPQGIIRIGNGGLPPPHKNC